MQSERLLLARPSVSVVACLLDPLIKYLCCQLESRKDRLPTRLAMALAGCAQRSGSLSNSVKKESVYILMERILRNTIILVP